MEKQSGTRIISAEPGNDKTKVTNKVNMVIIGEGKIKIVVKLKRKQRKKDKPPNCILICMTVIQIKATIFLNCVIVFLITFFFEK